MTIPVLTKRQWTALAESEKYPRGYFWSRASMVECAKLGLVTEHATEMRRGGGPSHYRITEAGRAALRAREKVTP